MDIGMIDQLVDNILGHVNLTTNEKKMLRTFWSEKTLIKGDYLLRNGDICRTDNYIVSGALKAFYINPKSGREEILYFAIDNWWASDVESFQKQKPSIYSIQALEKTHLLQITRPAFYRMLEQIPRLEGYFRIILESYLGSLQRSIIENKVCTVQQRYVEFMLRYPDIVKKVPHYLIASYLGCSAEFLSRVRKKLRTS